MIGTIRKHSKWLWGIVITATIVTFVFWGSSPSGPGNRTQKVDYGRMDGESITAEEFARAMREADLAFFFRYRDWPDRVGDRIKFDQTQAAYEQLFWLRKLKEYKIQVDDASVAKEARAIIEAFRLKTLDELVQRELLPRANDEDLQRYISHELGVRLLREAIALNGDVVTPAEARMMYVRDHQMIATEAAFFSSSNYLATVPAPSSNALAQFFEREQAKYRVPDQVQVKYVKFDATNFLAAADEQIAAQKTNFEAEVEQVYAQRGTNFYAGVKSPEEAKAKIRDEFRHQLALIAAKKQAEEFTEHLFNLQPLRAENLSVVAATNGLSVKVSEPFEEKFGPTEFYGGPNFAALAFALTPEEPFSEQVAIGTNAVYVIALDRKIPSEIPPLAKIHDQVLDDFKQNQAHLLAQRAGIEFAQMATNGLAQGKSFKAICADAKVKCVVVPPLALSTTSLPEVEDHMELNGYSDRRYFGYKQLAFATPPGKASGFSPTPDGGVVVYVDKRLPLDEAKMLTDLPRYYESLRERRKQETFIIWYQREAKNAFRDIPLLQQTRQPSGAPASG